MMTSMNFAKKPQSNRCPHEWFNTLTEILCAKCFKRMRWNGSKYVVASAVALTLLCGCTVVSANRVFPKLTWAWSKDAQMQRAEDKLEKHNVERLK